MIFDTHLWGLALGWSFATAAILAVLAYLGGKLPSRQDKKGEAGQSSRTSAVVFVFLVTFIIDLLITRFIIYYLQPSFVGSFGGYWAFLAVSFVVGLIGWFCATAGKLDTKKLVAVVGLLGLALVFVPMVQSIYNSWGTANKRAFSDLANIKIVSAEEKLPPTDQNHIVMVTQKYAAYKGSSVINSGTNIGSIFKTTEDDYTLQSVAGHLYWIAPLVYTNITSQVGILGTKFADSPGFVAVDAEDPNVEAQLHTKDPQGNEYKIRYLPDAVFGQNLARHVYLNGYTDGNLEDATLEVDDNWRPYYTITYLQPAFGIVGQKLDKVLLVDAQTGKIEAYEPSKVPGWVDRVMSEDLVKEYAADWGDWHDANSTWPNVNNQYQMKPLELEFHYNSVDKPVWVIPMVNHNGNQNAAAGILVYDTHDNSGTFYPGLSGKAVGDTVKTNFHDTQRNANGRLTTSSVQLYTVEGRPTWVAIYVNSSGQYGGIGMLDAQEPNVSNVVLEGNKDAVVRSYKNYLAGMGANQGGISSAGSKPIKLVGKIGRINSVVLGTNVTFFFTIEGNDHSFTATLDRYGDLPLVRDGDSVAIEYVDTKDHQEPVTTFATEIQSALGK